ncbi:hypothetical protein HOY80DRAFT_1019411 [Tuber brumale]|nr:hypothetical protein HOY80DRAFT_1019411 [Tuber brumale]
MTQFFRGLGHRPSYPYSSLAIADNHVCTTRKVSEREYRIPDDVNTTHRSININTTPRRVYGPSPSPSNGYPVGLPYNHAEGTRQHHSPPPTHSTIVAFRRYRTSSDPKNYVIYTTIVSTTVTAGHTSRRHIARGQQPRNNSHYQQGVVMADSQKAGAAGEEAIPRPPVDLSHREENDKEKHAQQGADRQQTEHEPRTEDGPEAPEESDLETTVVQDAELMQYTLRENRRLGEKLRATKEDYGWGVQGACPRNERQRHPSPLNTTLQASCLELLEEPGANLGDEGPPWHPLPGTSNTITHLEPVAQGCRDAHYHHHHHDTEDGLHREWKAIDDQETEPGKMSNHIHEENKGSTSGRRSDPDTQEGQREAIPTQQAGAGPEDRNRTSNKIRIKWVWLRDWISTTATTRIMSVVYENRHQTSVVVLIGTPPHAFRWGVADPSTTTTTSSQRWILAAIEAGILSIHGPFATIPVANYMQSLDATEGTLFTADQSKTSRRAIGSRSWTQDGRKIARKRRFAGKKDMGLMRPVNCTQQSNAQVGEGWIQSEGVEIDA